MDRLTKDRSDAVLPPICHDQRQAQVSLAQMTFRSFNLLFAFAFLAIAPATFAQVQVPVPVGTPAPIHNTGTNDYNHASGGPNDTELHWYLQSLPDPNPANPPTGPSHTVIETPLGGWVNSSTAQWIGPPLSNGDANTIVSTGTYTYQTKYTLPKYVDPNSVVITGSYASEDGSPGSLTPFTLDRTNASFGPGDNFLQLTVQNSTGRSGAIVDNLNLTYNLLPAPVINFTSPVYKDSSGNFDLDGTPNTVLSFTIPATNNPTSFAADGLPPGFSFNSTTGLMSGTPLIEGSYPLEITAQNSIGFDTESITFLATGWSIFSPNSPNTSNQIIVPRAYGNGVYVDVGYYNTSYTTSDGAVWNTHVIDNSASPVLSCVIFANGLFIAGGSGGVLYTSPDGATWTRQSSGTTADIYGFAFGNNVIVGICSGLQIITSTDGQHWTLHQLSDPGSLDPYGRGSGFLQVAFGNNAFAAVGYFGVYSSSDGQTWTLTEHAHAFFEVAFANGIFLAPALSNDGNDQVLTSTDATIWTLLPDSPVVREFFVGGGNVFLGTDGNGSKSKLYFSHDGLTWLQPVLSKHYSPDYYPFGLYFVNGLFIFPAQNAEGGFILVSHSAAFPLISTVSFASSASQVFENAGNAFITLTRGGDLSGTISVLCDTPPSPTETVLNAFGNSFTAVDGVDFQSIYQTVVFNPGETTKTVSIPIINNSSSADGRREIPVELIAQTEGVSVGDPATIAILDDDKSLQIERVDSEQDSVNGDKTVSFSANLIVGNTKTSATGPVRIKLVAIPGYNFFDPSFDAPPPLPADTVLGIFDVANGVPASSTATVAVTGTIPAPQLNGDGDVFWWVYAQLEEQVGTKWYPVPGQWPLLTGEILLKNGGAALPCGNFAHCHDTGGAVGGGGGGSLLPVLPPPPTLSGLNINGPSFVNKNSSTQYVATGMLSDNSSVSPDNVTWSASAFSISSSGVLTTTTVKKDTPVTITASATVAGVTQTNTLNVTVRKAKTTLATPTISPNGGTFSQSVQVSISDAALGATIRYTTNGSTPSKKSPVYSGPLTLTSSATVNAIATASGASNSSVASAVFTITP